jgi:hypothetical protein
MNPVAKCVVLGWLDKIAGKTTFKSKRDQIIFKIFLDRVCCYHSFFRKDKAAITRNAIPAHHRLPVRNQTITATMTAGMRIKTKRIRNIIIRPMIIRPMRPRTS